MSLPPTQTVRPSGSMEKAVTDKDLRRALVLQIREPYEYEYEADFQFYMEPGSDNVLQQVVESTGASIHAAARMLDRCNGSVTKAIEVWGAMQRETDRLLLKEGYFRPSLRESGVSDATSHAEKDGKSTL